MAERERGGNPGNEELHGKFLASGDSSSIWGWGTPAGQARMRRRVQWMVNTLQMKEGKKILELGCGTGIFSRELAKSAAKITAVDISPDLLQRARSECGAKNIQFVQGNLEEPDFLEDNSFDAICGISVLHHLDVAKALPALRKKLKPTGAFAFSEPNLSNPINKYYVFVPDAEKRRQRGVSPNEMAFKKNELSAYFVNSGFNVTSLMYRDFLHPAIPQFFIPIFDVLGRVTENIPYLQRISGSLWISGHVDAGND